MKALTVWQPEASLIIARAKPYEFRSWRPPESVIGQRIVIHASVKSPSTFEVKRVFNAMHGDDVMAGLMALTPSDAGRSVMAAMAKWGPKLGVALGTAIVGEPVLRQDLMRQLGLKHMAYFSSILWAWPLLDVERWAEPLRARGYQGLWNWPDPEEVAL